jgi:L-amino acid N-acyltransferase YncA
MRQADANQVLAIYQAGIDTGNATFQTSAPPWAEWDAGHLIEHRYVAVDAVSDPAASRLLGWIAASPVSSRPVYAGVVEHSVYVHPDAQGRGVGGALLRALIESTEAAGIWTLTTAIFPENTASVALHQASGFRVVGRRERLGRHHGVWRDVVLMERRSPVVS